MPVTITGDVDGMYLLVSVLGQDEKVTIIMMPAGAKVGISYPTASAETLAVLVKAPTGGQLIPTDIDPDYLSTNAISHKYNPPRA